ALEIRVTGPGQLAPTEPESLTVPPAATVAGVTRMATGAAAAGATKSTTAATAAARAASVLRIAIPPVRAADPRQQIPPRHPEPITPASRSRPFPVAERRSPGVPRFAT